MTLTISPTRRTTTLLRREAKRRGLDIEQLASAILDEVAEDFAAHQPNAETIAAMDELDSGGGFRAHSVEELCHDLGIPCER